ncbi:hypothetical protein [Salidesulfovibrio onnuriiensis]|uniref:hypothetical protein n=1 Tax=Salidesulfovibrio onnuriiensis TaxID=2583823 RepID=UPI0011CCCAD9|nr:hypothetical protein [Salidesulfovibrio onnuriiensis]
MDENVVSQLKRGFAMDLWETIRSAKGAKGERVFRHTMFDQGEMMVFAALFPKKELLEFPDLEQNFVERLKVFNLLGVATDGKTTMDMFLLGGMNKPFTSLSSVEELMKLFDEEPLMAFLDAYFRARGSNIDIMTISHDEFMKAVEREVFANTPMSELSNLQKMFTN